MRKRLISLIFVATLGFSAGALPALGDDAISEHFAVHDPTSKQLVSNLDWSLFLAAYVTRDEANGLNRVNYAAVNALDRARLANYLDTLQSLTITTHNRNEQLAYWLNLYNALTVKLILDYYPLETIRDIGISPGLFVTGPWGATLAVVEGIELSLDDIEHHILRAIWQDPRIHYGLNCASIGCPNLRLEGYRGAQVDAMLDEAARDYVNSPRGVRITPAGKLVVSSIYDWFEDDYGGSEEAVIAHLRRYAEPGLAAKLAEISDIWDDVYDWDLNELRDESAVIKREPQAIPSYMSTSKLHKLLLERENEPP